MCSMIVSIISETRELTDPCAMARAEREENYDSGGRVAGRVWGRAGAGDSDFVLVNPNFVV